MSIGGVRRPGARLVVFELDPRTALDVFFHLASSMHCEETTRSSRIHVAGLLPQLRRALVDTGIVRGETLDELQQHLMRKPAPPPIDDVIADMERPT